MYSSSPHLSAETLPFFWVVRKKDMRSNLVLPLFAAQKYNPAGYTLKRDTKFLNIQAAPRTFYNITAEVCQSLCDRLYDGSCCTLVFVQESNTCYISGREINMETATLVWTPGADLYIRDKCSGTVVFHIRLFSDQNAVKATKVTSNTVCMSFCSQRSYQRDI